MFNSYYFHLSILKRSNYLIVFDPIYILPFLRVPLIVFQGFFNVPNYLIRLFYTLPAVMGGTEITLLSRSTLTYRLQWTMLPRPGLESPSS